MDTRAIRPTGPRVFPAAAATLLVWMLVCAAALAGEGRQTAVGGVAWRETGRQEDSGRLGPDRSAGPPATIVDQRRTVSLQAGEHGFLQDEAGELHAEIVREVPYGFSGTVATAVAAAHYHFRRWSGDVDGSAARLTLAEVTQNIAARAEFEIDRYTLRFSGGDAGGVEVDGTVHERYEEQVPWNASSKTVTAVPDDPELFQGWTGPDGFFASDPALRITNVQAAGDYSYALPVIAGCSPNPPPKRYTDADGFHLGGFHALNVAAENGRLVLQTGKPAVDPQHIVLPFEQEVAVYFLYAGAGYKKTDFGWMRIDPQTGQPTGARNEIYTGVNDHHHAGNSGNGVPDVGAADSADRFGDRNGDGAVNALDSREVIGRFAPGTEIVFYLQPEEARYDPDHDFGAADDPVYLYTQTRLNRGAYRSDPHRPVRACDRAQTGDPFIKTYHLNRVNTAEGRCLPTSGWMTAEALSRAADLFGLRFAEDDAATVSISWGRRFPAVLAAAPADRPNAWILGWEDDPGGGDTDHNDLVFIVERRSGGVARSIEPLEPAEPEAEFTAADLQVYDYQPGGFCEGKTALHYYVSARNGAAGSWIKITAWDRIHAVTPADDGRREIRQPPPASGDRRPGKPEYTVRSRRIDLASLGHGGRRLVWKVEMTSGHEACVPRVIDATLSGDTAANGRFSRAAPVVQANVIYTGQYETPAMNRKDKGYRGHVTAERIYAADDPDQTLQRQTALWDAGEVLSPESPADRVRIVDNRTLYFPDIEVHRVEGEMLLDEAGHPLAGDGIRRRFGGRLRHAPVAATTLRIYGGAESFSDEYTDTLAGSLNGTGVIDRFRGQWEAEFQQPPAENVPLRADYSYYKTSSTLLPFRPANVTAAMLGLSAAVVHPHGAVHDFNGDQTVDDADAEWLVQWVRGYRDPDRNRARRWLLGAVDHCTPALMIPPGYPPWYFGSATGAEQRESYRRFRAQYRERPAVLFAGSRSGMLHAFDAGSFRHGDNPATPGIEENRGYFQWTAHSDERPAYCRRWFSDRDRCPDYGSGRELWAFIPANLLPRLKNNLLRADDRAYVDASPALADAFIDSDGDGAADAWRTVLLSAEGNGGDTVFCLDVTDPRKPRFLWEFAAPELFRSRSSPAVGRIRGTDGPLWTAFIVAGRTARKARHPAVYMIDVSSGRLLRRIGLDSTVDHNGNGYAEAEEAGYGQGGIPSGRPALVDTDANGYVDRFYVATDRGVVYKVHIPDQPPGSSDAGPASIRVCGAVFNQDFNDDGVEIPAAWRWQPIYGSPAVMVEHAPDPDGGIDHRVRVFFGTGDSPDDDQNIHRSDTRYHFFAYLDTAPKGGCRAGDHRLDWFIELAPGHRVFASAFAAAGQVYFGTATADTEDPCAARRVFGAAAGRIYGLDREGNRLLQRSVGDVRISPLVEDRHLYFRAGGRLQSLGAGRYNNRVVTRAAPRFRMRAWQQVE